MHVRLIDRHKYGCEQLLIGKLKWYFVFFISEEIITSGCINIPALHPINYSLYS